MKNPNYFDARATNWDADISKVRRAQAFATEILSHVKPLHTFSAMEYGCGTGLLSVQLQEYFSRIVLVDTSPGMLAVLGDKIKKEGFTNFQPMLVDLEKLSSPAGAFDVIYTMMTLHHVADIPSILKTFFMNMVAGGYLCIADLVSEDGSFHSNDPSFDGHNGFDRVFITSALVAAGFVVEKYSVFHTISKQVNEEVKSYPLFLVIARKQ